MASKTSKSNTKAKIKIGRKNARLVFCPECKTKYARVEAELPKEETCGVCLNKVTLQ